ncbi:hypothetical protein BKP42_20570 [Rhodococcus erythropolis]|nr:hypothetical protein BKP42_20570 [Rhodococcus erythropolis]
MASTVLRIAGALMMWVTRSLRSSSVSSSPPKTSDGAMTIVAPALNAWTISKTEASKLADENLSTRECTPTPSSGRPQAVKSTNALCVTATPFGVPVDPDV